MEKPSRPSDFRRIVFPAQHLGSISCDEAALKLRSMWPENVVKMVTVNKTTKYFDKRCGLQHLQIETFLHPSYDFDNYFARPNNDTHWPEGFVPFQVCNCVLSENCQF